LRQHLRADGIVAKNILQLDINPTEDFMAVKGRRITGRKQEGGRGPSVADA
jgi:hypothetical protein